MSADLACKACRGSGWERSFVNPWPDEPCPNCHGEGRRRPELCEWDALVDERDSIHEIAAAAIRERDTLRAELDAAHDARIEAQNPGIDIEDVRRHRREARARAVLDGGLTDE